MNPCSYQLQQGLLHLLLRLALSSLSLSLFEFLSFSCHQMKNCHFSRRFSNQTETRQRVFSQRCLFQMARGSVKRKCSSCLCVRVFFTESLYSLLRHRRRRRLWSFCMDERTRTENRSNVIGTIRTRRIFYGLFEMKVAVLQGPLNLKAVWGEWEAVIGEKVAQLEKGWIVVCEYELRSYFYKHNIHRNSITSKMLWNGKPKWIIWEVQSM